MNRNAFDRSAQEPGFERAEDFSTERRSPRPPPLPPRPPHRTMPGSSKGSFFALLVLAVLVLGPLWIWYGWRIEPEAGQIAVLIHKTGRNLPSGEIIAQDPSQKGILLDVLAEGRHFRNPYSWGWIITNTTDIGAGYLGVVTRLHGEDLPPGEIIATERSKGILREVLEPGRYRLNPFAYRVDIVPAINIRPGHVGVVVSLTGKDVIQDEMPPEQRNEFIVEPGLKGVQRTVLDPGTYYLNPYLFTVVEVNLQSQRFEMSGEDAISFLTADGFTITVEGTIEYALMRDKVALLTHQVGDLEDILKKIILPRARGFSRIEGSKHPAKNFITGDTRQLFQDNMEAHLRAQCAQWGIAIRSALIRNIAPPDQIASVIREREVALQMAKTFEQQVEQARSKAELTKQEMLAQQNKEKVDAETIRIQAVIGAQQEQAVKITAAQRGLEVARLENQASVAQAEAIRRTATAERDVLRMKNDAEAKVLEDQIKAFGTGMDFARNVFYAKLAPRIESVLSNDREGLGTLFLPYLPAKGKEAAQ